MYVSYSHRISLVEDGKRSPARGGIMVSHSCGCQPDLDQGSVSCCGILFNWEYVNWVGGALITSPALCIVGMMNHTPRIPGIPHPLTRTGSRNFIDDTTTRASDGTPHQRRKNR